MKFFQQKEGVSKCESRRDKRIVAQRFNVGCQAITTQLPCKGAISRFETSPNIDVNRK